jgi:hypothetical protein
MKKINKKKNLIGKKKWLKKMIKEKKNIKKNVA